MRLQFENRNDWSQTIPATEGAVKVTILITPSLYTSYNGKIYDETKWTNSNPILFYDLSIRQYEQVTKSEHEKQL